MGGMSFVLINGVKHAVTRDGYTFVEAGDATLLVRHAGATQEAVGGAYHSHGGGGRWITAKFGNAHPMDPSVNVPASDIRAWVITEKQTSISAYSSQAVRKELAKMFGCDPNTTSQSVLSGKAPKTPPEPPKHDVTYVDPTWEV